MFKFNKATFSGSQGNCMEIGADWKMPSRTDAFLDGVSKAEFTPIELDEDGLQVGNEATADI